jgi:hypothetical protein
MLSTKICATIAAAAAVAVAATAATGVAAAAVAVRPAGSVTQATLAHPTVVVAKPKEVGSASIKGYDNIKCESLLVMLGESEREYEAASKAGETSKAESKAAVVNVLSGSLSSSCLVID